jgi:putative N6-adenine-specific DNA methylase
MNHIYFKRIKRHIIAQEHHFFCIMQPGFEEVAKKEAIDCGFKLEDEIEPGGFLASGKLDNMYRLHIQSKTINRIIMRINHFYADTFQSLEKKLQQIPWELYFNNGDAIAVKVSSSKSKLIHRKAIEERAIKYIISVAKSKDIKISDHPSDNPQTIFIRGNHDRFTVSLDCSGELLYKRGYKESSHSAPIRETTAAAILLSSGFLDCDVMLDPMCGSGTFTLEAINMTIAPHQSLKRSFAFMKWPSFKEKSYEFLLKNEESLRHDSPNIYTSDIDEKSLIAAKNNINSLSPQNHVTFSQKDFFSETVPLPEGKKGLIVINPPYGHRLSKDDSVQLYQKLGHHLKDNYRDWGYGVIVPGETNERHLALKPDKKILFFNGGIKAALLIKMP